MKLKQIALAAAMVASGSVLADVNVYGVMDVNIQSHYDNLSPLASQVARFSKPGFSYPTEAEDEAFAAQWRAIKRQTKIGSGGLSTSHIGFKGTEDLGGGLKASFQLEAGINADTGTVDQTLFNRESWVGLTGSFGTVQLGKTGTSFDDVAGSFNHADNTNLSVANEIFGAATNYQDNASNQIKYTLPLTGSLTASIGYAFGENKTAGNKADNIISLGVKYEDGPFAVGYGRQHQDSFASSGDLLSIKRSYNLIGASYDFGGAKIVGSWVDRKQSAIFSTNPDSSKLTNYQLGLNIPIGVNTLYVGYANSGAGGDDLFGYVVAMKHNISKRTAAYAGYSRVKMNLNESGQVILRASSDKVVVGLRHAF